MPSVGLCRHREKVGWNEGDRVRPLSVGIPLNFKTSTRNSSVRSFIIKKFFIKSSEVTGVTTPRDEGDLSREIGSIRPQVTDVDVEPFLVPSFNPDKHLILLSPS